MEDRYFDHIVGCLRDAHERADNGWVKVTDDLVYTAMYLLKEQQAEIERIKRDGKTCANCSRCKTRMANGTGCYYPRCKKHNMWVRSGFYCSDWQKDGDGDAD